MFVVFTRVNGREGREGIGCVLVDGGTWLTMIGKFHTMGGEYLHELAPRTARCRPRTWCSPRTDS